MMAIMIAGVRESLSTVAYGDHAIDSMDDIE